nr:MAG TPA: hypothetical protein [Caudoviricetes sp.]
MLLGLYLYFCNHWTIKKGGTSDEIADMADSPESRWRICKKISPAQCSTSGRKVCCGVLL